MARLLRPALMLLLVLTVITGVIYPLAVMGVGQVLFNGPANGSEIVRNGKSLGSSLIGQPFADPKYFWSRPSATSPSPYAAVPSGASNQGPTNPALLDAVKQRVEALRAADPDNRAPVPVDLVTTSGSGLDPHISPAAAQYQLARVARARGMPESEVQALVEKASNGRQLGFLGEPAVNVLQLNLLLDGRW
jgi:K+-transporting ATPase ATPase C chain